jgi:hypothetical protein
MVGGVEVDTVPAPEKARSDLSASRNGVSLRWEERVRTYATETRPVREINAIERTRTNSMAVGVVKWTRRLPASERCRPSLSTLLVSVNGRAIHCVTCDHPETLSEGQRRNEARGKF